MFDTDSMLAKQHAFYAESVSPPKPRVARLARATLGDRQPGDRSLNGFHGDSTAREKSTSTRCMSKLRSGGGYEDAGVGLKLTYATLEWAMAITDWLR